MSENYELLSSPKKVYWVETPSGFDDAARIELLKHDIVTFPEKEGSFHSIKDSDRQIYIFNLDRILEIYEANSKAEIYATATDLLQKINDFRPEKSIIHTNLIDSKLESLFQKTSAHFMRENLFDTRIAVPSIINLMRNFMINENLGNRAFVRVNTRQQFNLRVNMALLKNPDQAISGILHDVSLNGAAIEVKPEAMKLFKLKDMVQAKVYLPRHATRIQTAVITRLRVEENIVGIHFDPLNERMIDSDEASALSYFIYTCIKQSLPQIEKKLLEV